jgi:hypothetical protein
MDRTGLDRGFCFCFFIVLPPPGSLSLTEQGLNARNGLGRALPAMDMDGGNREKTSPPLVDSHTALNYYQVVYLL